MSEKDLASKFQNQDLRLQKPLPAASLGQTWNSQNRIKWVKLPNQVQLVSLISVKKNQLQAFSFYTQGANIQNKLM